MTGGSYVAGATGSHSVTVSYDDVNRYREDNEGNNTLKRTLVVGASNTGTGLRGRYYNLPANGVYPPANPFGATPTLTRTDATVNFGWLNSAPGGSVTADNYAVSWEGVVEAPVSGTYTFTTRSDDGVRLFVNGVSVINNWTDHGPTDNNSAGITLSAGQRVPVRMEYYERGGGAEARLHWAYPGQVKQVVPLTRLYPAVH